MAYTKTNWIDRAVQYPNRYTKSNETATAVTLTASPGTVTQAGTPLSATNFNKIEQGIYDAHVAVEEVKKNFGPSSPSGTYFNSNYGLVFSTTKAVYFSKTKVYADVAGTITVRLAPWTAGVGAGTTIIGKVFSVVAGENVINLDMIVPSSGNYLLYLQSTTGGVQLLRLTSYTGWAQQSNGIVTFTTGGNATTGDILSNWYWFYDLQVSALDALVDLIYRWQTEKGTPGGTEPNKVPITNASGRVGDSEKVSGYSPSTGATPNTLVVRDANGGISGLSASGFWSDTTTQVAANTTYTKTIPIGFAGKKGRLVIRHGSSSTWATVYFNTDSTKATSVEVTSTPTSQFYSKALGDARLGSRNTYISEGVNASATGLTEVYISGSNLIIVFRNGSTSTATLSVGACYWEVEG